MPDNVPDASVSSLISFNNDTTMLGIAQNQSQSQSKILNYSSVSEKPEENPFSNSLLKKSVKHPSKADQRNVSAKFLSLTSQRMQVLREYDQTSENKANQENQKNSKQSLAKSTTVTNS